MLQQSVLQNIINQIQSGEKKIAIKKLYTSNDEENSLLLANALKTALESRSCQLTHLSIYSTFFTNEAIKILANAIKRNKTIKNLTLSVFFYNMDDVESIKAIGNMLKENKTITHFFLMNCFVGNNNIKYIMDGVKGSNIEWLNIIGNHLTTKGSREIAKVLEDSSTVLRYIDIGDNQIPKTAFEKNLLPAIRKNITLTFVDIYGNMYSEAHEEKIENAISIEMNKNAVIQKLWKEYTSKQSGMFTKQQQQYKKGLPFKSHKNKSNLPFELRLLIQQYVPKDLKSNLDVFIKWIESKDKTKQVREAVQKLKKFKKNL